MIQKILISYLMFFLTSSILFAQSLPPIKKDVDKYNVKRHPMRIGVCHFILNDPFSGIASDGSESVAGPYAGYRARIKKKYGLADLSVQFQCRDTYTQRACEKFSGEVYAAGGTIMDADPPIPATEKIRSFNFKSINGNGKILIYNQIPDVTGPGDQDGVNISFCLTSRNGATLLGLATVVKSKNSKLDLTGEAVRLIRELEFVK